MRTICVGVLASMCSLPSGAQGAAFVRVTHDDPDGKVMPGETVQMHMRMDWTPGSVVPGSAVLWHVAGDVVASPNIGVASNPSIGLQFPPSAPPSILAILNPGVASGGSVLGVEVFSSYFSMFGFVIPPWVQTSDVPILDFDWTAPNTPGTVVDFNWSNSAAVPQPQFIFGSGGGPIGTLPTTHIGTSLTVIPAPATLLVLAAAAGLLRRREPTARS